MADKDRPCGVEAGRQAFTDRRMPTRAEVKASSLARGRKLHAARGDHAKSAALLDDGTDDLGGNAA